MFVLVHSQEEPRETNICYDCFLLCFTIIVVLLSSFSYT